MRALEFITGHVIYNPAYTCKFQLKTTQINLMVNCYWRQDFQHLQIWTTWDTIPTFLTICLQRVQFSMASILMLKLDS